MIRIQVVHKYDCDVIVAGGGPAGSSLAFHLAKKGLKVIVLESHRFPRDKICGDAVSAVALAELEHLGITGLAEFAMTNEVNQVALYIKQEKIEVGLSKPPGFPYQGRVIPRCRLDNWIYHAARNVGALFLEDTRLCQYRIDADFVSVETRQGTVTKHLKAKVLVGADGSSSTVARLLYGSKPREAYQLLGLRTYYEGVEGPLNRCDIFFSGDNFPGLFWFFPTGPGTANIGSAMIASTLPKNEAHVKTLLMNQIHSNKELSARIGNGKMVGKVAGWPLTFHDPKNRVTANRLMLVGDAAGLINPLSGDGIQYALLSARWASDCLYECYTRNDFSFAALDSYQKKLNSELAYDMALSNLLIQVTRNRTFTPVWMEILLILFRRAKADKQYADIIAGIFDGTLPSYKALTISFIVKSIIQGGIHIGLNASEAILKGPESWINSSKDAGLLANQIFNNIKDDPSAQVQWLGAVVRNVLDVSGHLVKNIRRS